MAIVINRAVALAVACLTLLSACGGGGEDTPGATTGSLSVTVTGLPAGVDAAVSINGLDGYSRAITNSATLTDIPAGSVAVTAGSVTDSGLTYEAGISGSPTTVSAGGTSAVTVTYTAQAPSLGSLSIAINGLPVGVGAAVSVSGAAGYTHTLTAPTLLGDVPVGTAVVTASAVTVGAITYSANVSGSPATVVAGGSSSVTVTYAAAAPSTGTLIMSTVGLPAGTNAAIAVAGANGYARTMSGPGSLTDVPVGTATIHAPDVVSGGNTLVATVTGSPAVISADIPANVTVTYAAPAPAAAASLLMVTASVRLGVAETTQLVVRVRDATGAILVGLPVAWTSSNTAVATINANGVVTALSEGSSTVSAEVQGLRVTGFVLVDDPLAISRAIVTAYSQLFGLDVPKPPIVFSGRAGVFSRAQSYTSAAYVGNTIHRVYLFPDGTVTGAQAPVQRPAGAFRVVVVAVDYGNTNIAAVLNNAWPSAQAAINAQHARHAQTIGQSSPIVTFQNTNILATPQDVPNAANRADLFAFLATRGLLVGQDFDIAVSLALDASSPAGGLATGTDMVFMGCFFCSASASQTLSTDDLAALARAIYHHEIGHIWGWEHEWTGCGSGIEPNCGAFITAASLFGWTDSDGDSVPEIIDGTPYGRP